MTENRKTHGALLALFALAITPAIPYAAQDFSGYGTPELIRMHEQARYWDQADRDAYRNTMQTRMQAMTPDQRAAVRTEAMGSTARGTQGQGNRYGAGGGGGRRLGRSSGAAGGTHGAGGGQGFGRGGRR